MLRRDHRDKQASQKSIVLPVDHQEQRNAIETNWSVAASHNGDAEWAEAGQLFHSVESGPHGIIPC